VRGLRGSGTLECVGFEGERGKWGAGVRGGNRRPRVGKFERKLSCFLSTGFAFCLVSRERV